MHQQRHEDEDELPSKIYELSSTAETDKESRTNLNDLHDGTEGANIARVKAAAAHLAQFDCP